MNKRNSSTGFIAQEETSLKFHLLSKVDIFRDLSQEEMRENDGMVDMITCNKD